MKIQCGTLSMCTLFFSLIQAEKMKLYSFYTPSHRVLKESWFEPSVSRALKADDFELIIHFAEQQCSSAKFLHHGWTKTTLQKVENIIESVKDNLGQIFIYADIDIQFFRPFKKYILRLMQDQDLVIQRDHPNGRACSGFFACRANQNTLDFWLSVKEAMIARGCSDQAATNAKLSSSKCPIRWQLLPNEFYAGGTITGRYWIPGRRLPVPRNIILHHANSTTGVEYKIKQLQQVRAVVYGRKRPEYKEKHGIRGERDSY